MRVLFDITHPAQVHLFKNLIRELDNNGDCVLVTTRDKDVTLKLLDELGIEHVCLSRMGRGLVGMGIELLERHWKMLRLARRFRPDVMVARMGISIGPAGWILRIPRIVLEDSEHARLQLMLSLPFANKILTGFGYLKDYGKRQMRFRSFPVLAYMSPEVFAPDKRVLRQYGVDPDRAYILLRVVSWQAAHDRGLQGATDEALWSVVETLKQHGRVLISSERPLPASLKEYENPVPAAHLHDLLAFATLCMGEGGTIAAEAAVLGSPSVFCSQLRTGYLLALERDWGLLRNANTLAEGLQIAQDLLAQPDLRQQWMRRREDMLGKCEDVNEFMLRVITEAAETARMKKYG
jgi:uncharacterized protein